MGSNNYLVNLTITGDDLQYVDTIIKFISNKDLCTRNHLLSVKPILNKELFKNEYYIILYYIDFITNVKNVSYIDLNSIQRLVELDKKMFVINHPKVDFTTLIERDDTGDLVVQVVTDKLSELQIPIPNAEESFNLAIAMLKEITKDLYVINMMYTSSTIYYDGRRFGKDFLKGRDGYIQFMRKGLLEYDQLADDTPYITRVDRDVILMDDSSNEELFEHPLPSINQAWGKVKAGDSISMLAIQNVGKTTMALNYLASALIHGVNCGIFISEMGFVRVMSRLISILAAKKYNVKIPSKIVQKYFEVEKRKEKMNGDLSESDKMFLQESRVKINNIVYILNLLGSSNNNEIGSLFRKNELILENLDTDLELMRKDSDIRFLIVDHVNGIQSKSGMTDQERINKSYILLNSLGKKHGVANLVTNHIPEDMKLTIMDKKKDLSSVRGAWSTESTRSPDYVLVLDASMEQKTRGEFAVFTNKDRNSNSFFDPLLAGILVDVGMVYEKEDED